MNTPQSQKPTPDEFKIQGNKVDPATQVAAELIKLKESLGVSLIIRDKNLNTISAHINSMADFLHNPELLVQLSQVFFVSDAAGTTWLKFQIKKGRIVSITFLLMFKVNWVKIINRTFSGSGFEFILAGYSPGDETVGASVAVVPEADFSPDRIWKHFKLTIGQTATDMKEVGKLICYILSKYLINPAPDILEYISRKQGFDRTTTNKIQFTPPHLLYDELKPYLPAGLLSRQYPVAAGNEREDITPIIQPIFAEQQELQILLLLRFASWHQFLFARRAVFADNVLILKPSAEISKEQLIALSKNTEYNSLDVPSVGLNIKPLQFALETINDGTAVVIDPFRADQYKKAERGYDLLINDVVGAASNSGDAVHHITVLLSSYADLYIPQDKCCVLTMDGATLDSAPEAIKIALKRLDASLVFHIEHGCNHGDYDKIFSSHLTSIQTNIPETIPPSKRNMYIMLMTALRLFDELYSPLFDTDLEQYIAEWLTSQEQDRPALDDMICSEFGQILNRKIADGSFRLVMKDEVTPFDKSSHTIVVDRNKRCIYVETADTFNIAKAMQSISDTDKLTSALYSCEYLPHNLRNEKSVRIAAITSGGVPYPLYTHAINYTLLTPENRLRFDLIDKEPYLFRHDEMPKNFLPLVKTIDGRYAGKLLDYEREESNVYFGTGRTGSGKSWALAQMFCMLFMLGHNVVVFDVSGSFTEQKLRRMLPQDVVEQLFCFKHIGADNELDQIPVDLGSLKGCNNLPDKKRVIYSVLSAALGRIDREKAQDTKQRNAIKIFLSDYLKSQTDMVSFDHLISEMRKDKSISPKVIEPLSTVMRDIDGIGCDTSSWGELFDAMHRILVLDLGCEVGDSAHVLLDILVASLFSWQMAHDSQFLSIVIDELEDQVFSLNSPLYTVVKQGRKFHTALIGATQDYYNQKNPSLNVMRQANIQSFCRPGASEDRIAQKLGYANAIDAGFHHFKAGDTLMQFDALNKETGENEPITLQGKVVDFKDTPLYEKFKTEYLEELSNPETPQEGATETKS